MIFLWRRFLRKVKSGLKSTNIIQLGEGGSVHQTAMLKDVYLRGAVVVGERCKLMDGVSIVADEKVVIGRNTSINGPCTDIYAQLNPIHIGKYCSIARHVSIQEYNHRMDRISTYFVGRNIFRDAHMVDVVSKGSIVIGNDVWIGAHAVILSGVTIGDGAVIGANSVVSSDVPPYAIVLGNPAKVIRSRFSDEIIKVLLEIEWWNWQPEKIMRNKDIFATTLTMNTLMSIK